MHLTRNLILLLCASLAVAVQVRTVQAQTQPPGPPAPGAAVGIVPTTAPATQPGVPATQPAVAAAPRNGSKFSLNFKDASLDTVLNYLSDAAGYEVLKDAGLDVRITLLSKQPVSADEAVDLLTSRLKDSGNTIIKSGRTLRVMTRDKAKKSGILPVKFGALVEDIAKTDEMITQVIPVGSVDAVKLKADLGPLLNPDADVVANAGSNSIVVTDSSVNIRHLVEIITALDQHRTEVTDVKVFQLKYASASAAAKLITDIFKPPTQGGAAGGIGLRLFGGGLFGGGFRGGGGGGGGPGGPGGAGGGDGTDGSTIGGTVNASSDDRTNTLVVSGPTATLRVVERVVKELDANPAEGQVFFIVHLRNADSGNLQAVLNSFFGTGTSGSSSANRALPTSNTTPFGSTGLGSSSSGSRTSSGIGGGGTSFGSTSTSSTVNRTTTGGGAGSAPAALATNSDLIGHVYVVSEPDTNSLLVATTGVYADRVRKILEELDRAVPQVLIKVLIAEVSHDNTSDIGIEGSILNSQNKAGTNFGVGQAISTLMAAGSPVGAIYSLSSDNFTAALRALANTNKVDVLSRPYILASDNQLASVMSGQVVPYVSGSDVTSIGTIINSVSYQQVGVILNVTPHINPDGLVILDINPQVSSLATSTITIQSGVTAPIFNLLQAQSRVAIKSGQTIIIGGLMQDTKTETVDKVPLLGDIPILGLLFQHKVETKGKNELLIFLTPHVAQLPEVLKDMSQQEKDATKLVPGAVGPGVYEEHLRGMERGATTLPDSVPPAPLFPATQPAESSHDESLK